METKVGKVLGGTGARLQDKKKTVTASCDEKGAVTVQ